MTFSLYFVYIYHLTTLYDPSSFFLLVLLLSTVTLILFP